MRKLSFVVTIISVILSLSACEMNFQKDNTISTVELTEREEMLLEIASSRAFIFDYKMSREYEQLSIWVEKYEAVFS